MASLLLFAQIGERPQTVFHGRPAVRIQEDGVQRSVNALAAQEAAGFECVVSRIGDAYYWASRENRPMIRNEGPGYVTYVSPDGSGYVKILKPEMKSVVSMLKPTEAAFDYLEHMSLGLSTMTYFGSRSAK
jgi:hypothetical protein